MSAPPDAHSDAPPTAAASADLSNWRTAPFHRWAFHHVDEVVPVAPIATDPSDPWPLPPSARTLDGFRLNAGGGQTLDLQGFLDATDNDGFIVLLDGEIVHEAYANGVAEHTRHIAMSATKSLTGLVLGMLAERCVLDLEASVSTYLPQLAKTAYGDATLRQLIDMRAGARLDPAQQEAYAAATGWDPPGGHPVDLHAFYERLDAPAAAHGGPFAYISPNTDLLGWVIETAAGRPLADLVSDLIWKPLGAVDAAGMTTDAHGAPRCTGGFCVTVRDLARLGQLMVQDGARDGVEIIPMALIDDIADGGDAQAWKTGEFAPAFPGMTMRYRSGWYIIDDEPQTLFAMGIHGQNLFVDRANRLVIAKLSSLATPFDFRAVHLTHRAANEIRRTLVGA